MRAESPDGLSVLREQFGQFVLRAEEITGLEYEDPNKNYLNRVICRLPIEALEKSKYHYVKTESWWLFWSRQTCGVCDKRADDCWWLVKQKEEIRRRWTVTHSGRIGGE